MIGGNPNGKHRYNTYENKMGTVKELMEYFEAEIIRGRPLKNDILSQLKEIKDSASNSGTVAFFFDEGDGKNILMEKIYVYVKRR